MRPLRGGASQRDPLMYWQTGAGRAPARLSRRARRHAGCRRNQRVTAAPVKLNRQGNRGSRLPGGGQWQTPTNARIQPVPARSPRAVPTGNTAASTARKWPTRPSFAANAITRVVGKFMRLRWFLVAVVGVLVAGLIALAVAAALIGTDAQEGYCHARGSARYSKSNLPSSTSAFCPTCTRTVGSCRAAQRPP